MKHKEAFELIQNSKKILLHLHVKPDKDSVGSSLAMYHALTSIGKDVVVIKGDSELPESFSFIPGYEQIVKKTYFEIDVNEFDLFIIQDSSTEHQISRMGEVVFPPHLQTLVVDHHASNVGFGTLNIIDPTYSAVCEMLYDLFIDWNITITKNIAACLFVGIYGDTGGFIYASTSPRTMNIVAKIVEIYPEFINLVREMEYNLSKQEIYFEALALRSLQTFHNDSVAVCSVSYEDIQKLNIKREDVDNNKVASLLVKAKGWEVGIMMIEREPNQIGVSLRSRGTFDVSKVAVNLGGGGHKPAAGLTLKMNMEEAKKVLLKSINE
jgi:phosphoesterase RecJ-like protein